MNSFNPFQHEAAYNAAVAANENLKLADEKRQDIRTVEDEMMLYPPGHPAYFDMLHGNNDREMLVTTFMKRFHDARLDAIDVFPSREEFDESDSLPIAV